MKKLIMLGCALVAAIVHADYQYKSEMTVSGYAGTETLAGFPVLVRICANQPQGFNYGMCQSDGKDIAFTSPDGATTYPHEVEKWDTTGESLVWVRIPSLASTDTSFVFVFGDPAVTTAASSKETWRTAAGGNYAGVWHFGDTVTTGSEVATDSAKLGTANLDLTPKGTTSMAVSTTGIVGKGRVNSSVSGSFMSYETSLSGDFTPINLAPGFTASGWFRCNDIYKTFESTGLLRLMGRSNNNYGGGGAWQIDLQGKNTAAGWTAARMYGASNSKRGNPRMPAPDNCEWFHLALVYTAEGFSCYTNGVLSETQTGDDYVAGNNSVNFRLGRNGGTPTTFYGDFDEVRLLNVSASADWVAAEYAAASDASFVSAGPVQSLVSDAFFVASSGTAIGTVDPAYGKYTGSLAGGTKIVCTASVDLVDSAADLKYALRGWKLYEQDSESVWQPLDEGDTNTCNYVHASGTIRKLEWQMVNMRPLTLSANRSVSYLINGEPAASGVNWVQEGEVTVDVIATSGKEGEDFTFTGWEGDTSAIVSGVGSTNVVLNLTGATALRARYSNLHFVSVAKGDDNLGDGSREHPWATIGHALADAATDAGDEIRIAGGTYAESVAVAKPNLTIRGGYAADWTRDLANEPTIVVAANESSASVELGETAPSNRLEGVVVCGGKFGINVVNPFGQRIDKIVATNNVNAGINFPWWSGLKKGQFDDVVISSSFIAFNGRVATLQYGTGTYGISGANYNDFVPSLHVLNCTIVSNGTAGVRLGQADIHFRNTIIAGNGWTESRARKGEYQVDTNGGGNGTELDYTVIWNPQGDGISLLDAITPATPVVYRPQGLLSLDPRFVSGYRLAADSPLIKKGADLSAYEFPITEDVFGNAWTAGEYDFGCFRSTAAESHPDALADVYVSPTGDDTNSGADAAHPVKSPSTGLLLVAEGGTVHLAAGAYDTFAVLDKPGVTLAGAGRDKTVFTGANSSNAFGLAISAKNVTVRDLSVCGSRYGLRLSNVHYATNSLVERCAFRYNQFGFHQSNDGGSTPAAPGWSTTVTRFSRTVVADSILGACFVRNLAVPVVLDSCLVARNGSDVGTTYGGLYFSGTKQHYYNCTIASNANYGVYSDNMGNSARDVAFYDTIVTGSPIGWKNNGGYGRGQYCIFDCDSNYVMTSQYGYWASGKTNALYEIDAKLNYSPAKWGRPLSDSLANQGGKKAFYSPDPLVNVTADLDGVVKSWKNKWFIGCYAPPPAGLMLLVR